MNRKSCLDFTPSQSVRTADRDRRQRAVKGYAAVFAGVVMLSGPVFSDPIELAGSRHEDARGTPRLDFPEPAASRAKSADGYLRAQSARFRIPADLSNLERVAVRHSLAGLHTRYRQVLNGVPVEGAEIVVSQRSADGSVYQVYNNTYPVETPVPAAKNRISREAALQRAWDHLRVHGRLTARPKAELLYVPDKTGFRLVYKTLVSVDGPAGYWEHTIDALSGDVVSVRRHEINEKHKAGDVPDFAAYQGPTTSLQMEMLRLDAAALAVPVPDAAAAKTTVDGTALVFDPDPRTTLANDALTNTSAAASFDAAYFTKPLRQITLNAGVYTLQGPWVTITNLAAESPLTAVSTTTTGNWTAKRGNNAFNDVMCYFHIDQNQRYLQSLGYTNAAGIQAASIGVDSDGAGGADNSWYVPDLNYIAFGHGGVDDDEDADVILHEYGHALTHDIAPYWGGGDSAAIGEGFGDYWGASYSWTCTNGSTYHPAWAFSWDGHSADSWDGRFLDKTNLTYDTSHTYYLDHETIGGIDNYSDQLWGTPLYQAFRDLIGQGRPRTEMDTIIIESFFGVGYGVKMRDMASATVKAAMELYPAGNHAAVYYSRFANQLILVAYPLPDPTLVYPVGSELLASGSTLPVQWNRNGAPAQAAARIEYTSQLSGGGTTFSDPVEGGVNGWVATKSGGTAWAIATTASYSPTHAWFAANDAGTADQSLTRSSLSVTNGAVLAFRHMYDLEGSYDGGVVEISTNNGTTWIDLGTNATQNGYNDTISPSDFSAIAGRRAFTGSSGGFVETRIPLTAYAGKTVSLRFREVDDSMYAYSGWWVDDITITVDAIWTAVATTPTNTSSYAWTLPAAPGTNYGVRVKLVGSNCTDSSWAASAAFSLAATCVVTFDPQSGTVSPTGATVTNGLAYGLLPTPARPGYAFGGWWTGAGGTGTAVSAATTVTAAQAHTLYAKWTVVATTHGTPEPWLDQYGLVSGGNYEAADAGDTDGDGVAAWQEYVAGTTPTNAASVFRATLVQSGGIPCLSWAPDLTGAVPARAYAVFGVSNLANVFPPTPATNLPAGAPVPLQALGPLRFFKVGVGIQP